MFGGERECDTPTRVMDERLKLGRGDGVAGVAVYFGIRGERVRERERERETVDFERRVWDWEGSEKVPSSECDLAVVTDNMRRRRRYRNGAKPQRRRGGEGSSSERRGEERDASVPSFFCPTYPPPPAIGQDTLL